MNIHSLLIRIHYNIVEKWIEICFHKKIAFNENITWSKDEYGFESNDKIILNYEKIFESPSFLSPVGNLERETSKRYFELSRTGFLHSEDKRVGNILYLIFIYAMLHFFPV